ncbi:hypothetical protein QBC46DRAFT_370384 [Diplogelasinospora grovesii]|uniref:Aminoglycoside phosphotransferase domain-containing protein n=1 Tax=Diplogelasinospora grovesii TaxID=303347 RepID=A0AAN6NJG5_9PEZI|nr:hypothetical protein QBC46DRAFT_370384 [Diplogelasinospora grovesii]
MANARVVRVAELPSGENVVFHDSSFFKNNAGDLPSPEEVRQKDVEINGTNPRGDRPPPVRFEERGLVVKYGSYITVAEAQCLWYFNRHMKDEVPTPELFGWRRDGGETFIYMQLIRGDTLEEAWPSLSEEERRTICEQLRGYVEAWRELRQESEPYYIGHIGRQGVGDIIFSDHEEPNPGPFAGLGAFHDFFARYASRRRDPGWNPRRDPDFPELAGLTDDRPVVFTHADLCRRNIMVSPRDEGGSGSAPRPRRVVAILDWHQSGWYPIDWEWLKAQWMCEPLVDGSGGRDTAWLSQILAPADENYSYAWEYITSCW